jgi:quercetin dioxygenase-like cupin family protein
MAAMSLRAIVTMRGLITVIAMLAASSAPAAAYDHAIEVGADASAALALLPADHPKGTDAAVRLVSIKPAGNLQNPMISIFVVDYRPGGSAVLHRNPSPGYVLVHILSGSIQAQAWSAVVGTYRTGETWVEPAFANNITSKNASTTEPARTLIILVGSDAEESEPE